MAKTFQPVELLFEARVPVELRIAWREKDPAIERDAELFWHEEKLLTPGTNVTERLSELCLAAYHEDRLVGLSTARIRYIDFLTAKLAMMRVAVGREFRRNFVLAHLAAATREYLQDWSQANFGEQVMGVGTIMQSAAQDRLGLTFPVQPGPKLVFIGWTANGEQMRVSWFSHARIPPHPPEHPPDDVASGFD